MSESASAEEANPSSPGKAQDEQAVGEQGAEAEDAAKTDAGGGTGGRDEKAASTGGQTPAGGQGAANGGASGGHSSGGPGLGGGSGGAAGFSSAASSPAVDPVARDRAVAQARAALAEAGDGGDPGGRYRELAEAWKAVARYADRDAQCASLAARLQARLESIGAHFREPQVDGDKPLIAQ